MLGDNLEETLEKEVKLCVLKSGLGGNGKSGREGEILLLNFLFSGWLVVAIVSPWLMFKTSPRIA